MPPRGERAANATGLRILILAPSRCPTSSNSSPSSAVPVPRRAVHICSMMESTSPAGQSASVLVFENGQAADIWIVPIGAVALAAVVMANSAAWSMPGSSGVGVACLLIASNAVPGTGATAQRVGNSWVRVAAHFGRTKPPREGSRQNCAPLREWPSWCADCANWQSSLQPSLSTPAGTAA
jgi:hypothetical protein